MDCDVTTRGKRWHGLVCKWNTCLKVFLGKYKFKILGDGDMIADAKCWTGCRKKILESAHLCDYPLWEYSAQHRSRGGQHRGTDA